MTEWVQFAFGLGLIAVGFLGGLAFVAYLDELAAWWDRVRD